MQNNQLSQYQNSQNSEDKNIDFTTYKKLVKKIKNNEKLSLTEQKQVFYFENPKKDRNFGYTFKDDLKDKARNLIPHELLSQLSFFSRATKFFCEFLDECSCVCAEFLKSFD